MIVGEIVILCDVFWMVMLVVVNNMDVLIVLKDDFLKFLKEFLDILLEVMWILVLCFECMIRDLVVVC